MTWNYRVVQIPKGYAIHEVYDDDQGRPEARTQRPAVPAGDTLEELREDLGPYLAALEG